MTSCATEWRHRVGFPSKFKKMFSLSILYFCLNMKPWKYALYNVFWTLWGSLVFGSYTIYVCFAVSVFDGICVTRQIHMYTLRLWLDVSDYVLNWRFFYKQQGGHGSVYSFGAKVGCGLSFFLKFDVDCGFRLCTPPQVRSRVKYEVGLN